MGWLYLMIHFPGIFFCKIGITSKTASKRAKQIDDAVWGFPIPVMVMYLPFVHTFEQILHGLLSFFSVDFYKGDGHTEWFWLPAGVPVFLLGCLYWWGIYEILIYAI